MAVQAPSQLRVIRHESERDRWELVFGDPDPRLRPYVVHYCGYDEETTTFARRIEAPGLRAPLIFNFGPPVAVRAPTEGGDWQLLNEGFVAGLHDTYALVESSGRQSGVEVYLTPVGAGLVVGMPMRHLKGKLVTLEDCFGAGSIDPWRPRGIEVRGRAEAIDGSRPLIRIHPERIVPWGLEPNGRPRTV